jgi:hypothetical protein
VKENEMSKKQDLKKKAKKKVELDLDMALEEVARKLRPSANQACPPTDQPNNNPGDPCECCSVDP